MELAAEVVERVPSAEMVRMTSSGTEAAMSALRLARAATGRDKIVKFAGAYHGHSDGLLADAGSGLATQGIPASPGVTAAQAADTVIVPWNDPAALDAALAEAPAAIICEPYAANMGLVPPEPGFLAALREHADATGALLVFDEVITGFRVARGGAQEREGVTPDLTVLGKVIGGGLPAAAYAGRRELMELVAPAGDVYQAGTLSGNPLATAAGLATLRLLDESAYAELDRLARSARRRPDGGRARGGRGGERGGGARPPDALLLTRAAARLRGRQALRPRRARGLLPRRCSTAASTCRPRSSRPGSRRWPTATRTSSRPCRAAREVLAEL